MIRRYWIVHCNYCGQEYLFNGSTKPSIQELKESGIVVYGEQTHLCAGCVADYSHDFAIKRAGNLKQFQPGKKIERK